MFNRAFFRKAWNVMDTFDRVVCVGLSAFAFLSCTALAVSAAHGWMQRAEIVCVGIALGLWPWTTIPRDSRNLRLINSICGDEGPRGIFCSLEREHRGDHKHFYSNGGAIGWSNKGGAS